MSDRRQKIKKQVGIFISTLVLVLIVGITAMIGYSVYEKNNEGEVTRTIIDFSWVGQQTEELQEQKKDTDIMGQNTQLENQRLYNEAIEKKQSAYIFDCVEENRVTMAFAGDILLDDKYAMMYKYKMRGNNINETFTSGLLEKMRDADVFMINNEFTFSKRGTPTEGKQFTFRAEPENVTLYEQMGVDIVSLANNHAYDYGEEALLDTFTTLEGAGIPYVGAGRNIDEAKKPVYIVANGIKIAVVSATQIERYSVPDTKEATTDNAGVLRCMDPSALIEVITEAKQNSDFVVLYIHWGTESQEDTDHYQNEQALLYANAGVDLIIGDHPHCLQKIDTVEGVPVIYSLGNFWFNSKTQNTCLIEVVINNEGMEYFKFIPCIQEDCRTRILEGAEKEGVLNYMRGLSPNVMIDSEGYVSF